MKSAALFLLVVSGTLVAQQQLVTTPARIVTPSQPAVFAPTANTALSQVITQLNRQQSQLNYAAAVTSAQRRSYVPLNVIVKPSK